MDYWQVLFSDPELFIFASVVALSLPVFLASMFLPREKRQELLKDLWMKWG